MKILFVCRGNVGRSQMAEGLFTKTMPQHDVVSAGTKLSGPEQSLESLMPDNPVVAVMAEIGVDMSKSIRKQVTPEMAHDADKIILVVDEHDPIPEYLAQNDKTITWNVPDPKGQSLEFHREVRDQIAAKIEDFVTGLL